MWYFQHNCIRAKKVTRQVLLPTLKFFPPYQLPINIYRGLEHCITTTAAMKHTLLEKVNTQKDYMKPFGTCSFFPPFELPINIKAGLKHWIATKGTMKHPLFENRNITQKDKWNLFTHMPSPGWVYLGLKKKLFVSCNPTLTSSY